MPESRKNEDVYQEVVTLVNLIGREICLQRMYVLIKISIFGTRVFMMYPKKE